MVRVQDTPINEGLDIQLKILQSLSSLLQNFSTNLQGKLQATIIEICTTLQQVKSIPVSSTSAATLQQVVSSLFEKVEKEDASADLEVVVDGKKLLLHASASDAFHVLQDICALIEGQPPTFAKGAVISQPYGLELIETIITSSGELFSSHEELGFLLRTKVMSILTTILSDRPAFNLSVRAFRVFCIILREHLDIVQGEVGIPLGLLNHLLDSDSSTVWRRALCMESFRIIFSVPNLAVDLYALFDRDLNQRSFIQESLAHFVRLASEKPSLIGVGSSSTIPNRTPDQPILETNSVTGVIGSDSSAEQATTGITVQGSSMKIPCLEQLDKLEPPPIPETYIYGLTVTCLNNLSDGLAKMILPATMNQKQRVKRDEVEGEELTKPDGKGKTQIIPVNPLELKDHPAYDYIETAALLIDTCWPAILAAVSTFVNATLDSEYYRGLIRSLQRYTQIAGLLRLSTPQDAFLTTLTKSAIPPHYGKGDFHTPSTPSTGPIDGYFGPTADTAKGHTRRSSTDSFAPVMSQRNLMCLRALTNLAIALGPILENSWSIIIESLQRADYILAQSGSVLSREYRSGTEKTNDGEATLSSEVAAVESAVTRLFQSTNDYPDDAFVHLLVALCELFGEWKATNPNGDVKSTRKSLQMNRPIPQVRTIHFALAKIGDLARINIVRLAKISDDRGWNLLTQQMRIVSTSPTFDSTARLMAADILGSVALGVTLTAMPYSAESRELLQLQAIASLDAEIAELYNDSNQRPSNTDLDVHRSAVESVRAILENCGDSLIGGWRSTFNIVQSAFPRGASVDTATVSGAVSISLRIVKSAFACLQLICSDFLDSLKRSRIIYLVDILFNFCSQRADLNISLTSLTLFWDLSDHLEKQIAEFSTATPLSSPEQLRNAAKDGSIQATWMLLLNRLAAVTYDERDDVVNGAIQTLFRIFDSSSTRFDRDMWTYSFDHVILEMLRINLELVTSKHRKPQEGVEKQAYATTENYLRSLAIFLVAKQEAIVVLPSFEELWHRLLQGFEKYLDSDDDVTFAIVFETLGRLVSESKAVQLGIKSLLATLNVWNKYGPHSGKGTWPREERAILAYVQVGTRLCNVLRPELSVSMVTSIIDNIQECPLACRVSAYTTDADTMTPVQAETLAFVSHDNSSEAPISAALINSLSAFAALPYTKSKTRATFVAFAKASIERLDRFTLSPDVVGLGVLTNALSSLIQSVRERHGHRLQGKGIALWQIAARVAANLVSRTTSIILSLNQGRLLNEFLAQVVELSASLRLVTFQHLTHSKADVSDETFDLDMVSQIRTTLGIHLRNEERSETSASVLDSQQVASEIQEQYIASLYRSSIVHGVDDASDELEAVGLGQESPVIRPGQVHDPKFSPRVRMCYASLEELFAICETGDEHNGNGVSLRKVAIPYLSRRCSQPLSRFIADQPLRSRMPTPASQSLELVYILQRLRSLLQTEATLSKASTQAGVHGKADYLRLVMRLVLEASTFARKDRKLADAFRQLVEEFLLSQSQ